MRYTTIIDITEVPAIYRNVHARLLYLHLVLIAGYHDDDRDFCNTSIRRLAADVGLTESAVRHGLKVLERARLLEARDGTYKVKKWLPQTSISARTAPADPKLTPQQTARLEQERADAEKAWKEAARKEQLAAAGKTEFMIYYEGLMEKAAAGDLEAQRLVKRHHETYTSHVENMKKKSIK